jgi:integrase
MAHIQKRKTKKGNVYDIHFVKDGKPLQRSLGRVDRATANELVDEINRQIAARKYIAFQKNINISQTNFNISKNEFNIIQNNVNHSNKSISLSNFIKNYFDEARGYKSKSTIINEENYANKFLSFIGDVDLRSIDLEILTKYKIHLLQTVCNTTFNIERRFLHMLFNKALDMDYIEKNPVKKLKLLKVSKKRQFLTDEEQKRVIDLIDKDINDPTKHRYADYNRLYSKYIMFLIHTGLRRAEALALKKENISGNILSVEKSKGGEPRQTTLNPIAKQIVDELGDEMFSKLSIHTVSHKLNDILKRLGLDNLDTAKLKLHSLRHTFGTRLVQQGVDIVIIKELMGHANIGTTTGYAKADMGSMQKAVDKLVDGEDEF